VQSDTFSSGGQGTEVHHSHQNRVDLGGQVRAATSLSTTAGNKMEIRVGLSGKYINKTQHYK